MKIDQDTILLSLALMLVFILIFRTGKSFADKINPPFKMATDSPFPIMLGAGATAQCAPASCPVCNQPPNAPAPAPAQPPRPVYYPGEPSITPITNPIQSPYHGYMYMTGKSNSTMLDYSDAEAEMLMPENRDASLNDCIRVCDGRSDCKGIYRYMWKGKWSCNLKSSNERTNNVGENQLFYFKK